MTISPLIADTARDRLSLSQRASRFWGKYAPRLGTRLILWLLLLFFLIPLIWAVTASLKSRVELYQTDPHMFVRQPTLSNYSFALRKLQNFAVFYRNSLIVTLSSVILQTGLATAAGYGFARLRFKGRDLIFYSMVLLIFVPKAGGLMAQYELMNFLGLRNNLLGLVLAFSAGLPLPIFIMRQAFLSLPNEFEDAARIDGCNRFQTFRHIMLPLVTGAMVVVALFEFVRVWGEYLFTLTMMQQFSSATLEFGTFTSYGGQAAAYVMAAAPVVLFFLALQRWFVRGLLSGLKL